MIYASLSNSAGKNHHRGIGFEGQEDMMGRQWGGVTKETGLGMAALLGAVNSRYHHPAAFQVAQSLSQSFQRAGDQIHAGLGAHLELHMAAAFRVGDGEAKWVHLVRAEPPEGQVEATHVQPGQHQAAFIKLGALDEVLEVGIDLEQSTGSGNVLKIVIEVVERTGMVLEMSQDSRIETFLVEGFP